jgi:hypothetical protein
MRLQSRASVRPIKSAGSFSDPAAMLATADEVIE